MQCQYVSTIQAVMGQSIIVSDETVQTNECTLDKNWSALDIYYYYVVHHEHVNEHDELKYRDGTNLVSMTQKLGFDLILQTFELQSYCP